MKEIKLLKIMNLNHENNFLQSKIKLHTINLYRIALFKVGN